MELDSDGLGRAARNPFVAGALGALVALRFVPGITWFGRAFNVLSGSLCAGYLSPALSDWLHASSAGAQAAASFGIGLFGLSMAASLQQGIMETRFSEIIAGWFKRKGS